jgi:eukaryotic-like serine/threonine-protein kinase
MPYCINPHCSQRQNPHQAVLCLACQSPLQLCQRYRLVEPLGDRRYASSELFHAIDEKNPACPLVLKTLISDSAKAQALFQQEQQVLMQVKHPSIPQGYDAFSVNINSPAGDLAEIQCLVMPWIPGENLEDWIKHHGAITQAQAIDWLQQLLKALNYLHQNGIFHRDIKPSNIMRQPDGTLVLIDFGSIRQITDTILSDRTRTTVFSYGYTAPEQVAGRAVPQSDFYALGKTLMQLLMGTPSLMEAAFTPIHPVSPSLRRLLHEMTAESVRDRPATAEILLHRVHTIATEPQRQQRRRIGYGFVIGALCGGIAMIPLMRQIDWAAEGDRWFPKSVCDTVVGDQISCGEEALLQAESLEILMGNDAARMAETKKAAIQQVKQGNLAAALPVLTDIWQQSRDPETLVYLNNLRTQTEPNLRQNSAAIAVITPLSDGKARMSRGFNILRGVAQAQDDAIRAGLGLRVVLVDDSNDPQLAEQLAQDLVRRREIVAVVGHHVSDATRAALPIYEKAGLVAISPTSTSEELATYTLNKKPLFFRTVPSDRVTATWMVSFLRNRTPIRKVAVFYNPDKSYSRSLAGAFKETFQALQGTVIAGKPSQFALSCTGPTCQRPLFDLKTALRDAKAAGASALVVIPDAAESRSNALNEAIELVQTAGNTWVIAGDTLAGDVELLRPEVANRTVIVSAWDPSQATDSKLVNFWGAKPEQLTLQPLSWHTYTTYNAVQVAVQAIRQLSPPGRDRAALQAQLLTPGFKAIAADSTPIRFRDGSGELLNPRVVLTGVQQCGGKTQFQVLDRPQCR